MAHFAKLGTGNIVEQVEVSMQTYAVITDAKLERFFEQPLTTKDVWKQTFY
jgi:hypothetical protein